VCGSIGVQVHPVKTAFADSLGMTALYRAIFGRPRPGGPAAKAGIERYAP
jgi:S1-C subfamily serine protease